MTRTTHPTAPPAALAQRSRVVSPGARGLQDALVTHTLGAGRGALAGAGLAGATDRGAPIQRAFAGPPLAPNNPVNVLYAGHLFTPGGTRANTGCGIQNEIRTAGERKNGGASLPGTPANMNLYQYGFNRTGGLVRDPALNQAATRIHLINHRLENSTNTQAVASNILLGSKRANNPTHLHTVENHVIKALTWSSRLNGAYETALGQASTEADADMGGNVTWWPLAHKPPANVISASHLTPGWLVAGNQVTRTDPAAGSGGGGKKKKTAGGAVAIAVPDGYFVKPPNMFLPKHLWLRYNVRANYGAAPGFVTTNVNHERTQNGGAVAPVNPALEAKIVAFENTWKDDAFPVSFTSNATYFQASWIPGSAYHSSAEGAETIPTDT